MRGTINLNAPSYLPTLLGSGSRGASLLATLPGYIDPGAATADPAAVPEPTTTGEATAALVAAAPQVQRDIAQFTEAVAEATTPAQLLANPVALKVLLTANGLVELFNNPSRAAREQAISRRIDLTRFKSPSFVAQFTQRYLVATRTASGSNATATPDLTTLAKRSVGLVV